MSEESIESQGMELRRGDGGETEVFTKIPKVRSISGPGGSAAIIDDTDLSSTAKEKRMGLPDEGQITLGIRYIPTNAQHAGLRADRKDRIRRNFELEFSDGTVWSFAALVPTFSISGAIDDLVDASVTLDISGSITETPA